MSIDLGNAPVGTPPSTAEAKQMRGALGVPPTISNPTNATGGTINGISFVDETVYLESVTVSPVATMNFVLPSSANSIQGQIKMFISSKTVTTLYVTVAGGGTIIGTQTFTASANEPYSFQHLGAGRWIRLA